MYRDSGIVKRDPYRKIHIEKETYICKKTYENIPKYARKRCIGIAALSKETYI